MGCDTCEFHATWEICGGCSSNPPPTLKREEANDRLEKAISPPQTSKAVQPITINNSLDFTIEDCRFTKIDADGNVIPEMED